MSQLPIAKDIIKDVTTTVGTLRQQGHLRAGAVFAKEEVFDGVTKLTITVEYLVVEQKTNLFDCPDRGVIDKSNHDYEYYEDHWRKGRCSHCGSISSVEFMNLIQHGRGMTRLSLKRGMFFVDIIDGPDVEFNPRHLSRDHREKLIQCFEGNGINWDGTTEEFLSLATCK